MDKQFIPYKNYNFDVIKNLILSYFVMYPTTYVSNIHLGERLGCSTKTISRTIKFFSDNKIIEITNPKGKSRTIKLVDNYEKQVGQCVHLLRQSVQLTETNSPSTKTNCPSKRDNMSHYNKEIRKFNNKDNNKVYNKGTFEELLKKQDILSEYIR